MLLEPLAYSLAITGVDCENLLLVFQKPDVVVGKSGQWSQLHGA